MSQRTRVTINNNVRNGDFETTPAFVAATNTTNRWIDGTAAGSTTNDAYGWGTNSSGTWAAQFDSSEKHGGNNSIKLSTLNITSFVEVAPYQGTTTVAKLDSYAMSASPSTSYTISGLIKTNLVSGTATNGVNIEVSERDAAGTLLVSNLITTAIKTTTDWTFYTKTFTTNANTIYIVPRLIVYGHQGTGTLIIDAWFDDVTLTTSNLPGQLIHTGVGKVNGVIVHSNTNGTLKLYDSQSANFNVIHDTYTFASDSSVIKFPSGSNDEKGIEFYTGLYAEIGGAANIEIIYNPR